MAGDINSLNLLVVLGVIDFCLIAFGKIATVSIPFLLLAPLSHSDKVSFCDQSCPSSSFVR